MIISQGLHNLLKINGSSDPYWPLVWPLDSEWTLVIVTLALVGITAYYAYQTRELANRPYTPRISASFDLATYNEQQYNVKLNITNVGMATATNVKVEYSVPDIRTEYQVRHLGSIQTGFPVMISTSLAMRPRGQIVQIHLKYWYKNIFNKKYRDKEELTVTAPVLS
jgi:uncharacterized protein (TIGR02588 family)